MADMEPGGVRAVKLAFSSENILTGGSQWVDTLSMDCGIILPGELSTPWLKPAEVVDLAACALGEAERKESYKRLANMADNKALPFIKPGKGRTSMRFYPPLAIVRLRLEYELQGAFSRHHAAQMATDLIAERIELLAGRGAGFDVDTTDYDHIVHIVKRGDPLRFEEYDTRKGWPNMRIGALGGFFGILRLYSMVDWTMRPYRDFRTDEMQRKPERVKAALAGLSAPV